MQNMYNKYLLYKESNLSFNPFYNIRTFFDVDESTITNKQLLSVRNFLKQKNKDKIFEAW